MALEQSINKDCKEKPGSILYLITIRHNFGEYSETFLGMQDKTKHILRNFHLLLDSKFGI